MGGGADGRMRDVMIDKRITWIRMKGWLEGNKLTGERGKWSTVIERRKGSRELAVRKVNEREDWICGTCENIYKSVK